MECGDFNEGTNDHCYADANCTNNVGSFVYTKIQMRHMNVIVSWVKESPEGTCDDVDKCEEIMYNCDVNLKGFKLK